MELQLAMHSSPRFATWIWLPDWRLLIDAGDGVTQHLGYKILKIDTLAMTHAHRDHIGGLLQAINQRGQGEPFTVAHPCGARSFRELEAFANKWNPGTSWRAVWRALEEGDQIETGIEGRFVKAFRTRHYLNDAPQNPPRSVGYSLVWRKQKVRPEYRDLPQAELDAVRAQVGREGITQPIDETWVCVSGDTEALAPAIARGARLLLHEATFLSRDDIDSSEEDASEGAPGVGHVHSTVEEALRVAREAEVPNLVLYHLSTRYTDAQIREAVRALAQKLELRARVWCALPRRVHWDLLRERPVWEGA